ncbi:MAG: hypothetical protein HC848_09280, partial [Limnobacter sp.]|nr:hypothetical protein [Limnobacter sp.]
ELLDQGIALLFTAPHSYTGEDVLELQGHGGPAVLDLLLSEILQSGVRLARPGEFSERAFLNNKIDLVQAEAIADLINASHQQAARNALHSLQGVFSQQIKHLIEQLIQLRIYVEAAIDFPEEEIDFLPDYLDALRNMQTTGLSNPARYFLVAAQHDEVLSCQQMLARYSGTHCLHIAGSDHALSDFDCYLPFLRLFLGLGVA